MEKKTAHMSAAEIREQRLKVLYRILPIVSLLLLVALWLLASSGCQFQLPNSPGSVGSYSSPVHQSGKETDFGRSRFGQSTAHRSGSRLRLDCWYRLWRTAGMVPQGRAFFGPLFNAFRAVPPLAWIPLITLWFGAGEFPKVLIVIFGSLASIVVNTQAGLSSVNKMYLDVGTVFKPHPDSACSKSLFHLLWTPSLPACVPLPVPPGWWFWLPRCWVLTQAWAS